MLELPPSRSGRQPLEIASQVARAAGGILLSSFSRTEKKTRPKGRSNLVTEADYLSEQAILRELRAEFPSCGFLSEESEAVVSDSPFTWVVDPMDGSNNFSFGVPFFSVNLALLRREEVVLGVTYDPVRDELFYGLKGQGAFVGGKPLRVSARTELKDALVGFDMGYDMERGREMLEAARKLWTAVFSFRIMGSAALVLAYVASGRLDLYLHRRLYPWDILAGRLLVEEAGGLATDWEGRPVTRNTHQVVAGNPALPPADYRLAVRTPSGRGVYSFCMCPGGEVMNAASGEGQAPVNGMSVRARNSGFGNSGIVASIAPAEFGEAGAREDGPLAGIGFQEAIERRTFDRGGGGYGVPAANLLAFVRGMELPPSPGRLLAPRVVPDDLRGILPGAVEEDIRFGLLRFGGAMRGFLTREATLYAVESRTSSPVRIERVNYASVTHKGLYPVGEGAGHAGGIVSSAVDGIRAALRILETYSS